MTPNPRIVGRTLNGSDWVWTATCCREQRNQMRGWSILRAGAHTITPTAHNPVPVLRVSWRTAGRAQVALAVHLAAEHHTHVRPERLLLLEARPCDGCCPAPPPSLREWLTSDGWFEPGCSDCDGRGETFIPVLAISETVYPNRARRLLMREWAPADKQGREVCAS